MQENKSDDQIDEKNQTDSSNSRSPLHLLKVSLDKVRIVGDLNWQVIEFIMNKSPLEMQFTYQDPVSGRFTGYIQTKNDKSTLNFEFNPARANATKSSNFWVEWNPNKIDQETVDIMENYLIQYVSNAHITRLDFAFDFENDFSDAYLMRKSKSKSGVWYGTSGLVETRYFGSEKSNKHYKIYNKKVELQEKQNIKIPQKNLWRVEVTLKGKKLHEIDAMFDNFFLGIPDLDRLEIRERAMIFYLIHHENAWNDLGSATKSKYRKLIQVISDIDVTSEMVKGLKANKECLIQQANGYLKTAITAELISDTEIVGYDYF